jgi:hypothetical protein
MADQPQPQTQMPNSVETQMTNTRHPDWQLRLMQYIAERARTAIDPNGPVCAEFTAGAVEAITGRSLGIAWRGKYPTVAAGLKALRKAGYADHVALAADMFDAIPPAFAGAGDIAVLPGEDGIRILGVVQGPHIYVQTVSGIGAVPLTNAILAFKVA